MLRPQAVAAASLGAQHQRYATTTTGHELVLGGLIGDLIHEMKIPADESLAVEADALRFKQTDRVESRIELFQELA